MKFRATIGSSAQLTKLVVMLDKMAESCVVHLTPEMVAFAVPVTASSGVQLAAELLQRSIFLEHRIESRAENNRISFFVKLENLSRALKSCSHTRAQRTQVKLTKKMNGGPTLTFEILMSDAQVRILHDVPIRIVQDPAELRAYAEPDYALSSRAVSVVLPQAEVRALKNVAERMLPFSDYLMLTATDSADPTRAGSNNAQLQLEVKKDNLVTILTTFRNLDCVQLTAGDDASQANGDDGRGVAAAKLELKKLSRALQSLVASDIKMHSAICCLIPDVAVVLKVFLPSSEERNSQGSYVVFYFPARL